MEDKLYALLSLYKKSPYWLRYIVGKIYYSIPNVIKYGKFYNNYLLRIRNFNNEQKEELLKLQIQTATKNIPYYQDKNFKRLQDFPIVNKSTINSNFEEFFDYKSNFKLKTNTGGSSGNPFEFYLEKGKSRPKEKAHFDWYWGQFGYNDGDKILMIRGESLPNNKLFEYEPIGNKLIISCYLVDDDNIAKVLYRINSFKPKFIHAYPSALSNILHILKNNGLKIQNSIEAIFLGSEGLIDNNRKIFNEFFNARIVHWYGHSERLIHAGNCPYSDNFHIFPFYGHVELVDDDDREIKAPHVKGRIIATGFDNKVMPLIRYDTGDEAEYAEEIFCKCGFKGKSFSSIHGRAQDYVYLDNKSKVSLTAFIFGQHFDEFSKIIEMQLEQHDYGKVLIRLRVANDFQKSNGISFKKKLESSVNNKIKIDIKIVDFIPKTIRGKHQFLLQQISD